jgi:hypothetical protein
MNTNDRLDELKSLAIEMKETEEEIKDLEKQLEDAKERHKILSSVDIPTVMSELGFKNFTLSDGTHFSIKPVFVVNTPPAEKMDAVDNWLTQHNHGGMVKYTINIGKKYLPEVEELLDNNKIDYETKKTIHWQTLNAWAREMEINSMVIPEDIFTIYRSTKTVIGE